MIRIPDSSIGDTRTCDWSKVSKEDLLKAYANTAKLLLREVVVDDRVLLPGYLRGYGCCYQDRCENVPLGSLGPDRASVPDYIPSDQREGWLAGYQVMAEELYGPDWKTAEFVWKPAMEIRKEDK